MHGSSATAEAVPKFIGIANTLDAAPRSDPDVEATWDAPAEAHYADCLRLATRLKQEKKLIPRLTVADAADIVWCQTSIGAFESLVVDRALAGRPLGALATALAPHAALRRRLNLSLNETIPGPRLPRTRRPRLGSAYAS